MEYNSKTINRKNSIITNVNDIVFRSISSVIDKNIDSIWTGTMTELMSSLNRVLSKKQRTILPGSPSALRIVINRIVNRLRNRGIGVKFVRTTDHNRTRLVKFTR